MSTTAYAIEGMLCVVDQLLLNSELTDEDDARVCIRLNNCIAHTRLANKVYEELAANKHLTVSDLLPTQLELNLGAS